MRPPRQRFVCLIVFVHHFNILVIDILKEKRRQKKETELCISKVFAMTDIFQQSREPKT